MLLAFSALSNSTCPEDFSTFLLCFSFWLQISTHICFPPTEHVNKFHVYLALDILLTWAYCLFNDYIAECTVLSASLSCADVIPPPPSISSQTKSEAFVDGRSKARYDPKGVCACVCVQVSY